MGSVPGLGRFPGGGNGNPLQYSCLENPKDKGAWYAIAHRVAKSRTWLKRPSTHAKLILIINFLNNYKNFAFSYCLRTARRSNQSILKEINPEYPMEDLMLKSQCFGYLMRRANSLEKTLRLGKIEGRRRRRRLQGTRWLDSIIDSMDMNVSKLREILKDREAWCAAVHGVTKSWTQLSDWTKTTGKT